MTTKFIQLLRIILDKIFLFGILVTGISTALVSIIAFWGDKSWEIDILAHFQLCYTLIFLSIMALALAGKRYKLALLIGILSSVNMINIIPYYFYYQNNHQLSENKWKLITLNINSGNMEYDLLREFITQQQADFLFLQEISTDSYTHLANTLNVIYPYQQYKLREDNFGIATFSKIPFTKNEILYFGRANLPSVFTELNIQGMSLAILQTHPLPPIDNEYSTQRDEQLAIIADFMKPLPATHKILVGDLNATPWSYPLRQLFKSTQLKDSALGYGVQGSWPNSSDLNAAAWSYLLRQWFVTVPIDHVLISDNITVLDRKIGQDVGSDHYPVIVHFSLAMPNK